MKGYTLDDMLRGFAFGCLIEFEGRHQMPGNCFTFAVGVCGQVHGRAVLERFGYFTQKLFAVGYDVVLGNHILPDLNGALLARKSPHMALARKDNKILAEKLRDGFGLCRRLDDYQ